MNVVCGERGLRRGAEAEVRYGNWEGRPAVFKNRVSKGYRHKAIDERINAERTRKEARMLNEMKTAGIRTPYIYYVDVDEHLLVLEELEGKMGKEILDGRDEESKRELMKAMGRSMAMLHSSGLAHGDLTTSNMIMTEDGLGLIDVSLANKEASEEEMGVDLRLFEEAMTSTHPDSTRLMTLFYASYRDNFRNADVIMNKCEEIRSRGRYL